jgi:NitT/TauT family transport system permease protein/taurine transport system permease protein
MRNSGFARIAFGSISIGSLLLAWWFVTEQGLIKPLILPPPAEVWSGLVDIWHGYLNVPFWNHFIASISVMLGGYAMAILIGVPLGIFMAWNRWADWVFGPLLQILRPIPPPAWIPLAILWFGIGYAGKIFIVFIAASVPCIMNSYLAIKQTPPELLSSARSLGAKPRTLLFEVAIPSGLPTIMTGLRIALGFSWASIVAAELVVSLAGFGFLIMNGYRNLESNIVFVGMAAVALIGIAMNFVFVSIERRLVPWREDQHHG